MADDQASQRRSRLAPPPPPPTASTASTFRAPPAATPSRFGFGSSSTRSSFGSSTNSSAARTNTLSTSRASTFSSSAFGRSTPSPTQRPSSAEAAGSGLAGSRLRQKATTSTTAAVAAPANSAPKQSTTSDLFATFASDTPAHTRPTSLSSASASSAASSTFGTSYNTASAIAAKPAKQLFSMDDTDLGGDDGWGVDSPSNILSPISATDETTAATTSASKPFEDEGEFSWSDDTAVTTSASSPIVMGQAPASVVAEVFAVPEPSPPKEALTHTTERATPTPAPTSLSGWGGDFEYTADATEAPTDSSAWNDEDEWGTIAPEVNGATATVAAVESAPLEAAAAATLSQVPPLSTASADLGAILSPTSGPAGEFWGDEGDDVLFSDEEQAEPDTTPVETPLPDVGALSLVSTPVYEETKQEEAMPAPPVANDFGFQDFSNTVTETMPVAATSEWEEDDEEEGDWGEELRLSDVTAETQVEATAQIDDTTESAAQAFDHEASATSDMFAASPVVLMDHTIEGERHDAPEFDIPTEAVEQPTLGPTSSGDFFEAPTQYSHTEPQHKPTEPSADYFSYGDNSSFTCEDQNATVDDQTAHQNFGHQHLDNHEEHEHYTFGGDSHQHTGSGETVTADATFNSFDAQHDSQTHQENTSETIQRQVSWEAQEAEADTSALKAAEDSYGTTSFPPPSVSTSKAEVSFGTSSFAAAELTYGHYHHDTHRTPSEAEAAGSVASFAEASSAGATFGGSDHVSDGTYSDGGDYASETRSVFGSSSAHSTAFITEPASSSDGQASNEDNDTGTYENRSDMSSTVGGGGGASEFDVSSTRSALFENEVASITGFEHGDDTYEYGDHGHPSHFDGGGSYENEYSHNNVDPSAEDSHVSSFGHTNESMFTSSTLGRLPDAQQSPSPVYSRSSTPATYGDVSSSQDLPTASDLEFDHSDTENLFASSSSEQETTAFAKSYQTETTPTSFAPVPVDASVPVESGSTTEVDDANPFASSGSSFPSMPTPSFEFASSEETLRDDVHDANDEALPSADSLFGPTPPKGTPFRSFAPPQQQPPAFDETPIADAGGLFADAPAAPAFGGFEQPPAAPASSFFGGNDTNPTSAGFGYDAAPSHYGYDDASYPPAEEAFGDSAHYSQGYDAQAYGHHDSSYQSASDTFGEHASSTAGFDGGYGYEDHAHHSAADAFGAPAASGFGGHENTGFGAYGAPAEEAVSAENFFGGSSSATSAAEMFGANDSAVTHHDQHDDTYYHSDGHGNGESWQVGSEHHRYSASSAHDSYGVSATEESTPVHEYGQPPVEYPAETASPNVTNAQAEFPEASSFETNALPTDQGYVKDWTHEATTESHALDSQPQPPSVQPSAEETSAGSVQEESSFDHGYAAFDNAAGAADSFFGHSTSAPPPDDSFGVPPQEEAVASGPSYPVDSPITEASAFPTSSSDAFESASPLLNGPAKALPRENHTDVGESSVPFDHGTTDASNHPFEGESEFSTPFADQSLANGAELHFGGDAANAANPFGQSTDATYQTDTAAFFGGQETNSAFGEMPNQEASGAFSNGPSDYHHSGGIYAQPPHEAAASAYQHGYDESAYTQQQQTAYTQHQHEGYSGYNEYAHDPHSQPDAFAAHPSPPQNAGVGYAAAPSHNVKSPTASGPAHFVTAQSASPFGYNQPTGTPVQHDLSRGQHQQQPHHDASYGNPTFQPSASPKTPTPLTPSPLHAPAAHPNYNQFAAPAHAPHAPQVPSYGATYETKAAYGEVADGGIQAKVLTSTKYKDPNMVVPSCLASFGFGGNVVTMFPKQKLRLNGATFAARNSPRSPLSMQFDSAPQGELRKGPIGVYRMDHVHPRNSEFEELDKFPGPLNENVAEEAILQYVDEKMNAATPSTPLEEDERLLLGVLRVLIKCNGRLRSEVNANPNEPTSPEVQLVSLLKESDQRRRRNHPSQFPPPKPVQYPTHPDATLRNASRVRELLLLGDRKAAVDVAIQAQMWPEAMLIGSFTDKDEYKRVLCAYFTSHYAPGDPCRALYLSFADQQEKSVHEPQKLMQQPKDEDSSAILSTWVVHVQMLLANRTADTNKILVELGDRLWKEANGVVAAHVCYLLAGNTVEAPSPSSKIALLGADHRSPEEARFYVSPAAVQRTEIYEWIQKKINPAATNMIPFQGYKLIYAMILADHGKLETAFKYVNSMLTVIRAITATMKPGSSMYLEGMQNQLVVLDDRLRQHLGQDRADSVAAASSSKQGKWGLGSALSIVGKIVNRVVEGNDTPQPAGPPRSANGSLFQGAPRSNTSNAPGQPEYPSGAAVGYSSQAAPSLVPTAPGSGRNGGVYASHPAPYNTALGASHVPAASPSAQGPVPAAPVPTIPAAFNVPRQVSGRASAPPHQPMPDYAAPSSGSGGNAFGAPLSNTSNSAYDAPPQHQPPAHQRPSFPSTAHQVAPPHNAPPPFQKPSLDLSGSVGNNNFGNELLKPKSPLKSPRARSGDAPGSDKGKASPKAKEAPPKKGGRSKTPPPSRSSSSGWLSGISTFLAAKMNPDAKVAKLGEHMDAYYDEEKKRWVFPGETQTDEPVMPSAPPTGPLPGSTPASSSGGPLGGPHGVHSAPGSMAGGAAPDDMLAALMAPPPARALMKKDPLAAMMAPPPNRAIGPRANTMPTKRPPPRPQFAVFKPAPGMTTSSAPSDSGPPSTSGEAPPQ